MAKSVPLTKSVLNVLDYVTQKYLSQPDIWSWGRERQVRTTHGTNRNVHFRGDIYIKVMDLSMEVKGIYKREEGERKGNNKIHS